MSNAIQDGTKDPMSLTVGEYFKTKAEMEAEIFQVLQALVVKYRKKLGMTPSWIEIQQVERQGIGDARKEYLLSAVRCHFEIQ